MRFQSVFAAEDKNGLSPIEVDKVKKDEISTVKASSDYSRLAKEEKIC